MNFHLINTLPWLLLVFSFGLINIVPESLGIIFLINLWGLSYPHTISTFTKKAFKRTGYKISAIVLLVLMIASMSAIAFYKDLVFIMNIYFLAQFIHYIRQNYGISRSYLLNKKAMDLQINGALFFFYLITRDSLSFFQFKIWTFPIESPVLYIYFFHLSFVLYRKILLVAHDKKNLLSFENIQYILFSLFVFDFISFEFVWIGMNMIHNLQYLLLVNHQDHGNRFLYFNIPVVLISFVLFKSADYINANFQFTLSVSFILVISLNFCHYIFDSFLWKKKYRELS